MIQSDRISYDIEYNTEAMENMKHKMHRIVTFTGEVWVVYCEDYGENWRSNYDALP